MMATSTKLPALRIQDGRIFDMSSEPDVCLQMEDVCTPVHSDVLSFHSQYFNSLFKSDMAEGQKSDTGEAQKSDIGNDCKSQHTPAHSDVLRLYSQYFHNLPDIGEDKSDMEEAQKSDTGEVQKSEMLEAQKSDTIEVQKSDIIEVQKSDTIEAQKSDTIEAQKSDTIEAQKSDTIEVQKSNTVGVQKSDMEEAQKSEMLEAQKYDTVEAQKSDIGKERKSQHTVKVQGFTSQVVTNITHYMYSGKINIELEDIPQYLSIVTSWQLEELKDRIEDYIISHTDIINCIYWFSTSNMYGMKKVITHTTQFLGENMRAVSSHSEFLQHDFGKLLTSLTDDLLANISCDMKLLACDNWISADEDRRSRHYKDLLDGIGFNKYSKRFLELVLRIFIKSVGSADKAVKVCTALLTCLDVSTEPAGDRQIMMVLSNKPSKAPSIAAVLKFDLDKMTREEIGVLPRALQKSWSTSCVTPYGMFMAGRGDGNDVWCALLTFPSLAFVCLPDLSFPVEFDPTCAVCIDDNVYLFIDGSRHMYCLDLRMLRWSQCAPFPFEVSMLNHITACGIGTKLYVLSSFVYVQVYCYDTSTGKWSCVSTYPMQSQVDMSIAVNQDIYSLNNYDGHWLRFSTTLNKWTLTTRAKPRLHNASSAAYSNAGRIVLCHSADTAIELYDIQHNAWVESPLKMPWKRFGSNIFSMLL